MGADLLLMWTKFPVTTDGERIAMADLPALCAERIAAYLPHPRPEQGSDYWGSPQHWREALEHYDLDNDIDPEEIYLDPVDSTAELNADELALVRRILTEDVAALATVGRGELAPVTIGGTTYLFTGGPSWGDAPTEVFDSLERIDTAGLFDQPFPTQH